MPGPYCLIERSYVDVFFLLFSFLSFSLPPFGRFGLGTIVFVVYLVLSSSHSSPMKACPWVSSTPPTPKQTWQCLVAYTCMGMRVTNEEKAEFWTI